MNVGDTVTVNTTIGLKALNLKVNPDQPFIAYGQQLIPVTLSDTLTVLEVRKDAWDSASGRKDTMVKLLTPGGRAGWCFGGNVRTV